MRDTQNFYLNTVMKDLSIEVSDYTIYNDYVSNLLLFEQNNVLYHYLINNERLIIGKFCSIAYGTKFLFNYTNHILISLPTYTFFIYYTFLQCKYLDYCGKEINGMGI